MFNRQIFLVVSFLSVITACGGSGGGEASAGGANPGAGGGPNTIAEPTRADIIAASRFANRGSYGLNYDEIYALAQQGTDAWLDEQFARPVEYHTPDVKQLISRRDAGEFSAFEEDEEYLFMFRRFVWWDCAVRCEDQLRQRVANALSQILVISDVNDILFISPAGVSSYYDVLLEHAFGNYRDMLGEIARHPAMGFYLSHLNNDRSRPENNTFPDENFARELMQLFTIGLYELNIDGSHRLDAGASIPTYDNDDIREFAKIFTGFSYGGPGAFFGKYEPYFDVPMRMFEAHHEPGAKQLFNTTVPAGQSGVEDFEQALDVLFEHPNVGPFIGKQLIQRLVTSNPSPDYVRRVAQTFNNNGSNVRGDMQAVVRAILTDPEALAEADTFANFGKLREPLIRYLNLIRLLGAREQAESYTDTGYFLQAVGLQHPLSSPSVFNFYQPEHAPAGEISSAALVAPEFQILNTSSIVNMVNLADAFVHAGTNFTEMPPFPVAEWDFSEWEALAEQPEDFVERLNIVLAQGNLKPDTVEALIDVADDIEDIPLRAKIVIYMLVASADYVIEI